MKLSCVTCSSKPPESFTPLCTRCGGMIDVTYDLASVALADSENPYERFRQLLPVEDAALLPRDARPTPTVHATALGAMLGMPHLYLKDETVLPTRTTKDRMAAVALAYMFERGVRGFCASSTGNSSSAFAAAIVRFEGMRMHVFTASRFRDRVQLNESDQVEHYVMRDATFVEATAFAREFAGMHGLVAERGFFNPGRREGLKLAWLEAVDQVPRAIDWYVQAVSSAMGVYGTFKGGKELVGLGRIARPPRLLCVQQETCAPMVHAWHDGSDSIRPEHVVAEPDGIAPAILRGDPSRSYPYVQRLVRESDGTFVSVSADEIREAQRMTAELEGLRPCLSAATAVAGLLRLARSGRFPLDQTVLINLTGAERDADPTPGEPRWMRRAGSGWTEEPTPG